MQIQMTIKGLTVDPVTNTPIVVLRDLASETFLPIWIGVFEANAIAVQIENVQTPRPMTHDLLFNVFRDLHATIDRIVVSDLKDSTFYALIHVTIAGEPVAIDARPSDAIALAVRASLPIFVEAHVIEQSRHIEPAPSQAETERLHKWLESLDPDDLGKYKM